MKKKLVLTTIYIASLVVVGAINVDALTTPKHAPHMKKGTTMDNVYPVLFANTLQNGLTDAKVLAQGNEAWRKRRTEKEMGSSGHLLVSRSTVFIITTDQITAVDATGKDLWNSKKWPQSTAVLFENVLYCQSYENKSRLARISLEGGTTLKSDIVLPSTADKEKMLFFAPLQKEFLACCQLPASQKLQNGKAVSLPPYYTVYRKPYDNWDFTWVAEGKESVVLPVMLVSNGKKLCIGTRHSMTMYNSESTVNEPSPLGNFAYPMQEVKSACADSKGNLYFIGVNEKTEELIACDENGKVKWKWQRAGITGRLLPPVVGSNDEVIVINDSGVCCVNEGKLFWEFSTGLQDPNYVTATSDGSVLISAGDLLFCCKEGKEVFSFEAGSSIIAPPVVDTEGSIYVLTPTEVIKVI